MDSTNNLNKETVDVISAYRKDIGFPFGAGLDPYGNPIPRDSYIEIIHAVDKDGKEFVRWNYIPYE